MPRGCPIGEESDGACGMPAGIAASRKVRSWTRLSEYSRAAAPAPQAVWPPTVPYGTALRYWPSTQSFEWVSSRSRANRASRILRS